MNEEDSKLVDDLQNLEMNKEDSQLMEELQNHIITCQKQIQDAKAAIAQCETTMQASQAILTRIKKRPRDKKESRDQDVNAFVPQHIASTRIECAETIGDCIYSGTSDGKFYSRIGNEEPKLLFAFERSVNHGCAFINIKHVNNGTLAIACLPGGKSTMMLYTPGQQLRYLNIGFTSNMNQRNMGVYDNKLLTVNNYKSLQVSDIHSGETTVLLTFERYFISYGTRGNFIFVSFYNELRIFENDQIVDAITLPYECEWSEVYNIRLITDEYVFFKEHALDRLTNQLIAYGSFMYNMVQIANGNVYAHDEQSRLCKWDNEKWDRIWIVSDIPCRCTELLVSGNDVFGVTQTDVCKLRLN